MKDGPADRPDASGPPGTAPAVPERPPVHSTRASVRRSFLLLLLFALLPLVLLGIGRSAVQLERSTIVVQARLSERATETARSQAEVVRTARAVLTLLADQPDVRSGGILCDLALTKVDQDFAAFSNLSRFDSEGRILCSSAQPLPKVTVDDELWWSAAHRRDNFLLAGPQWGPVSKRQVLGAVLPMTSETGAFEGVIIASIDMGWMANALRSREFGEDALALVLDGSGRILLSNRPASFTQVQVAAGAGKTRTLDDNSGRRWTYAVAPLARSFDGRNALYVAYAMPEARLFSWSWWQAGLTLATPFFAVFLVSLVIWFGTNGLVLRWLRQLHGLARAFSKGDYRARMTDLESAPTEFQELAAALYTMAAAVERRDTDLRVALDRQNLLVREIHHRVKNNLQIVMSLLSLQVDRLETDAGRAAMRQTRLRISTLALVHRLLYETGEQSTISSKTLFDGVCELLEQTLGKRSDVVVKRNFADVELPLDTAIPLCLWLVEAASNAWAHAFPDGRAGEIGITMAVTDGQGTFDVVDNGIGIVDPTARDGLAHGLRILSGIAKQVGGTIEISSVPGNGTRLRLCFPMKSAGPASA